MQNAGAAFLRHHEEELARALPDQQPSAIQPEKHVLLQPLSAVSAGEEHLVSNFLRDLWPLQLPCGASVVHPRHVMTGQIDVGMHANPRHCAETVARALQSKKKMETTIL